MVLLVSVTMANRRVPTLAMGRTISRSLCRGAPKGWCYCVAPPGISMLGTTTHRPLSTSDHEVRPSPSTMTIHRGEGALCSARPFAIGSQCRGASTDAAGIGTDDDGESGDRRGRSEAAEEAEEARRRARLDVAIVGMPNAGKSQLLNVLCRSNVAAVSRKRHTTRQGILGARTVRGDDDGRETQIVFVDTPGFLRRVDTSKSKEEGSLLVSLSQGAAAELRDADLALLVVDAARTLTDECREALAMLMLYSSMYHGAKRDLALSASVDDEDDDQDGHGGDADGRGGFPLAIVLNKVDLVKPKTKLLDLAMELSLMAEVSRDRAKEALLEEKNGPTDVEAEAVGEGGDNGAQSAATSRGDDDAAPPAEGDRPQCPVFMVSALHDDGGVDDVLRMLVEEARPGRDFVLEGDETTDLSPVERVEEVLREKLYRSVHKEVPHNVTQMNRIFEEVGPPPSLEEEGRRSGREERGVGDESRGKDKERMIRIEQDFIVRSKSHQRILLGKDGAILRRIERQAVRDLEKMFQCRVGLVLRVKLNKSKHMRTLAET